MVKFNEDTGEVTEVKICDFGLCSEFYPSLTLTEFCGSPGFFDPEMIIEVRVYYLYVCVIYTVYRYFTNICMLRTDMSYVYI